jgi:hypothetical protein
MLGQIILEIQYPINVIKDRILNMNVYVNLNLTTSYFANFNFMHTHLFINSSVKLITTLYSTVPELFYNIKNSIDYQLL